MCCGLGIVCNLHKVFRNNIQWASLDSEETWIRFQQEVSSGKRKEERGKQRRECCRLAPFQLNKPKSARWHYSRAQYLTIVSANTLSDKIGTFRRVLLFLLLPLLLLLRLQRIELARHETVSSRKNSKLSFLCQLQTTIQQSSRQASQ